MSDYEKNLIPIVTFWELPLCSVTQLMRDIQYILIKYYTTLTPYLKALKETYARLYRYVWMCKQIKIVLNCKK